MNERIICSAIWYKDFPKPVHGVTNLDFGVVICGHRHPHIIGICHSLLGKRQAEMGKYEQGFLTNLNRFVGRVEALEIALRENQIKNIKNVRGNRLHSEDLY